VFHCFIVPLLGTVEKFAKLSLAPPRGWSEAGICRNLREELREFKGN
jgi:hypothetical protein